MSPALARAESEDVAAVSTAECVESLERTDLCPQPEGWCDGAARSSRGSGSESDRGSRQRKGTRRIRKSLPKGQALCICTHRALPAHARPRTRQGLPRPRQHRHHGSLLPGHGRGPDQAKCPHGDGWGSRGVQGGGGVGVGGNVMSRSAKIDPSEATRPSLADDPLRRPGNCAGPRTGYLGIGEPARSDCARRNWPFVRCPGGRIFRGARNAGTRPASSHSRTPAELIVERRSNLARD